MDRGAWQVQSVGSQSRTRLSTHTQSQQYFSFDSISSFLPTGYGKHFKLCREARVNEATHMSVYKR